MALWQREKWVLHDQLHTETHFGDEFNVFRCCWVKVTFMVMISSPCRLMNKKYKSTLRPAPTNGMKPLSFGFRWSVGLVEGWLLLSLGRGFWAPCVFSVFASPLDATEKFLPVSSKVSTVNTLKSMTFTFYMYGTKLKHFCYPARAPVVKGAKFQSQV